MLNDKNFFNDPLDLEVNEWIIKSAQKKRSEDNVQSQMIIASSDDVDFTSKKVLMEKILNNN